MQANFPAGKGRVRAADERTCTLTAALPLTFLQ
jgi:hypothetical protein